MSLPGLDDFRASTSSVAGRLAAAFDRAADLLEQSAEMAVLHAEREATKGRDDRAAIDRERARQAWEAARRGRDNARRWR